MKPVRGRVNRPGVEGHALSYVLVVALVTVGLSGCAWGGSPHSPYEADITEARGVAEQQLDRMNSKLQFTDRVTVLGTAKSDSCGAAHNWWFDNVDPGYRCWMKWTVVAVIPTAQTSEEVAAAVDAEFAALDLPYFPGGAVRSYMLQYPRDRQPGTFMQISAGGHEGSIRLGVDIATFRADTWPPPSLKSSTYGTVSGSGDAPGITVEQVQATGAIATVEITLATEYWNTGGLDDLKRDPKPDAKYWERTSWGDKYVVEIADWAPADAQWDACAADPAIDQASVVRVELPFPYVKLTLLPTATNADLQRIGNCIWPTLTSGTLVTYDPYE